MGISSKRARECCPRPSGLSHCGFWCVYITPCTHGKVFSETAWIAVRYSMVAKQKQKRKENKSKVAGGWMVYNDSDGILVDVTMAIQIFFCLRDRSENWCSCVAHRTQEMEEGMVIQTVIRRGNCKSFQGQHINQINLGHLNFSATIYPEYTYKTQSKKKRWAWFFVKIRSYWDILLR